MSWYGRDLDDRARERQEEKKRKVVPLYARGVDRAKAENIVRMFMQSYQPPVTCAHKPGPLYKRVGKERGLFLTCLECGMVLGVMR